MCAEAGRGEMERLGWDSVALRCGAVWRGGEGLDGSR